MDLPRRITAQALVALIVLVAGPARSDDCAVLRARFDAEADLDPRHSRSRVAPWLRRDAFLAAELARTLRDRDAASSRTVLFAMAALETEALSLHLALPAATRRQAERCGEDAVASLLAAPDRLRALAEEPLPSLYLDWRRLLGGYAFARPFLRAGAERWRIEERAAIAARRPAATLIQVPERAERLPPTEIAALLTRLRAQHPLAWPEPDPLALRRLGDAFAPELATHEDRSHTRIGALLGEGGRPVVDTARPRAYLDHGFVRWGHHVLLQLSYSFWFTERPRSGPLDPYGGAVDGLVLRLTLADDGRVLAWESIHPCGCFYTVAIPEDRALTFLPADPAVLEPPLLLGAPPAAARVRAHYSPQAHYLRALAPAGDGPSSARRVGYVLAPYAALLAAGPDRPPFDARGLLRGSERGERLFLWPSGIRSPGAMRSSGRQATAFLGRRRFEAPDLVGGRLRISP